MAASQGVTKMTNEERNKRTQIIVLESVEVIPIDDSDDVMFDDITLPTGKAPDAPVVPPSSNKEDAAVVLLRNRIDPTWPRKSLAVCVLAKLTKSNDRVAFNKLYAAEDSDDGVVELCAAYLLMIERTTAT